MKIWHSSYQLVPKGPTNSRAKTKYRKGALLRVRFDDLKIGYSDLCPFSEMGDRPLERELKHLLDMKPSPLGERSLYFARLDAEARAEKRNVFAHTAARLKNHFLIHDILRFDLVRVSELEAVGYTEFKVKMGWDIPAETERLDQLCARANERTRLRLDFNGSFSRERFVQWFERHQSWLRPRVEFFEDPFMYDPREWSDVSNRWNIPLALDFAPGSTKLTAEGAAILVIKPAVEDEVAIIQSPHNLQKKFVFTHYLDFPLGQMAAYFSAAQAAPKLGARLLTCGLQHHETYERLSFQDAIKKDGPFIVPPDGAGFGFDQLLENQQWIELR